MSSTIVIADLCNFAAGNQVFFKTEGALYICNMILMFKKIIVDKRGRILFFFSKLKIGVQSHPFKFCFNVSPVSSPRLFSRVFSS